ncbi:MAG: dipeptidase [Bradymonadaceae bacterium]
MTASDPESYIDQHRDRFLQELETYLSIPSISTSPDSADDVRRCAEWLAGHLSEIGLPEVEIFETDGHPIVYAEHCEAPDRPTILVYAHYDVQPPDPLDEWESPPFEPEIRDGKIFARGATDDKGQFFAHVKGLESHLATEGQLPVNVKMLVEGEEEVGSAHLEPFVAEHAEMLECDSVLISDSAMFDRGLPTITYGLRGLAYFEVEVQGPERDLHSGLYGGAVPNPIDELAGILGQLHDEEGRVAVPGFYDNVRELSDEERAELADLPFDEEGFRAETGAAQLDGEAGYTTLERRWARPTLDCNGIWGGYTDEGAKTVLPARASAKFSCRLVPHQKPERIEQLVIEHVRELAPESVAVSVETKHSGQPIVTERDTPTVRAAERASEKAWNEEAVFTLSGGSIPVVSIMDRVLDTPTVLLGFGLNDDRLHSPNEKFELENFYKGIETSAYLWELAAEGE